MKKSKNVCRTSHAEVAEPLAELVADDEDDGLRIGRLLLQRDYEHSKCLKNFFEGNELKKHTLGIAIGM